VLIRSPRKLLFPKELDNNTARKTSGFLAA